MSDNQYGVINEIGDMGLGFKPVSESEQKQIEKDKKAKENKDKK